MIAVIIKLISIVVIGVQKVNKVKKMEVGQLLKIVYGKNIIKIECWDYLQYN